MTMVDDLTTGMPVYTLDGDRLGTVKEFRGTYFKVDVPMAADYWLSMDGVRGGFDSGHVTVDFAKPELDEHRRTTID